MNGIEFFITSFCTSCILLGFLYTLCPSGSMSNSVKYIFCLCFVCCVIGASICVNPPDFSDFDKNYDNQILTEQNVTTTAQMIFSEALTQKSINFRKITVDTNKLDDVSIGISRVMIYTSEPVETVMEIIGSDDYEVVVVNE